MNQQMSVTEMLQIELREHMTTALNYKQKIETAKTQAKKDFYNKKLKKNNLQAARILTALERLKQRDNLIAQQKEKQEPINEAPETE